MATPLESLIKASVRCVKCGAHGFGACKCWDKSVTLECKKCKKRKKAMPDPTDPKGTARVLMLCPDCNSGDFDVIYYFDAAGKEITAK